MHGGLGGAAAWFCPLPRRCCPDRIARGHPSCLGSILLFIHSSLPIGTFLSWWLLVYACPLVLWCALWCSGALWCSVVLAVVCAACGFWLVFALFFDDSLVMFDDDHFLRSNIRANVGGVRNTVRGSRFGGEVVVVVRAHQTTWLYCAQEIPRLHENKKTHTHHFSPRSSIIIQNTSILRFLISLPHF